MSKLSPEARALFDAVSDGDGPSDDDRARVRGKLAVRLGAGVAVGTAVGTTVASGSAVAGAKVGVFGGLAMKLLAVVAVAGGIGGATYAATRDDAPALLARGGLVERSASVGERVVRESAIDERTADASSPPAASVEPAPAAEKPADPEPPPHRRVGPAPTDAPPAAAPPSMVPAPASTTPTTVGVAPAAPGTASPAARDSLSEETALLGEAQAALRQGHGDAALHALDRHSERFRSGALREEGQATRILVLCQLGRVDEARAEAARFLRDAPRSPMAARVRASCAAR